MRKNLKAKAYIYPLPVLIVATFDENGVPKSEPIKLVTTLLLNSDLDVVFDFEAVDGTTVANTAAVNTDFVATLQGTAGVFEQAGIGNVLTITSSKEDNKENYLALPEQLFANADASGYTLSMWVKPADSLNTDGSIVFDNVVFSYKHGSGE